MSAVRGGPGRVDFGHPVRVLRRGPVAVRIGLRPVAVTVALAAVAVGTGLAALGSGSYEIPLGDVAGALLGRADGRVHMVVVEWRLPRVLLGLLFGAALGASGAIFQSLTRNPLGSPDIIGFATGSYTGALVVILLTGGGYAMVAGGALAGGLATAAVVYLLAWNRGVSGFRLIIVGIAVSAMLAAANAWLILRAELDAAMSAAIWGAGSLARSSWEQVGPVLACLAVLVPLTALLAPRLGVLEMGDDTAAALGLRVERLRLALVVLGVALTALVTAAAGPISFIALAAPQLARRLTGRTGVGVGSAAAMGAALLAASDWAAQRVIAPNQLPVGVVTVCIGGGYLLWLLIREARTS